MKFSPTASLCFILISLLVLAKPTFTNSSLTTARPATHPPMSTPGVLLDTVTSATTLTGGTNPCPCPIQAHFMGNAWTNNALPIGTTSITVTGFTFYVSSLQNQSYTNVVARIQLWNTYNGPVDPVFSNPGPLVTASLGPQSFFAGSKNRFSITLPSPITLTGGPSTNWWGVTVNFQGNTGSGLKDTNDLAPVIASRSSSGGYAVGQITSPGVSPTYGFYKNRSGRTDFNFNPNDGFFFSSSGFNAQGVAIIIYGTSNAGPVPTPTPTPTPTPSITLNVPNAIVVPANNSSGTIVQYSVSATDSSGVTPVINCAPPPGNFPIGLTTVSCTATGPSGSVTKSFLVTVTPLSKRFTPEQKQHYKELSEQFFNAGEATEEVEEWFPDTDLRHKAVAAMPLFYFLLSIYYSHLAEDPPDSDYTSIIKPTPLKFQPVSVSSTVPAPVATALNALYANQAQVAGLAQAIFITNNRADGAMEAHDIGWEQKQMQAAATFASQSAALLESQTQLLVNLQTALSTNGFPTISITQSQIDDFKNSVIKNGLPASMLEGLTQMGADQATINNIRGSISMRAGKPAIFPALLSEPLTQDALQTSAQGLRAFALNNIAGQTNVNAVDDAEFFVRQHYLDFLNRQPDAPGLAHWTGEISQCNDPVKRQPGESLPQCTARKRANTSAAFFFSPEFQNTGSFVLRVYWGTLGKQRSVPCQGVPFGLPGNCRPQYSQYLADARQIAQGIVVNDKLAPAVINANKHAFVEQFVSRPEFTARYNGLTNAQFVDRLFETTGVVPTFAERDSLIVELANGSGSNAAKASVVFKVVDGTQTATDGMLLFNTRYGQAFFNQEFDAAFVYMEYLGYLRRNPDQAGYDFWLAKLKQYGNWVDAQMVLAFIISPEYRSRFGPP